MANESRRDGGGVGQGTRAAGGDTAELTITVHRGATGGTLVSVGLRTGPDVPPHEHEADHRRLVSALLPFAGAVERERPAREPVVG